MDCCIGGYVSKGITAFAAAFWFTTILSFRRHEFMFISSCAVLGLVRFRRLSWPQPGPIDWLAAFLKARVYDKMSSFSPAGYGNELFAVRRNFKWSHRLVVRPWQFHVCYLFFFLLLLVSHFAVIFPPCLVIKICQMNYDFERILLNSNDNTCLVAETGNNFAKS